MPPYTAVTSLSLPCTRLAMYPPWGSAPYPCAVHSPYPTLSGWPAALSAALAASCLCSRLWVGIPQNPFVPQLKPIAFPSCMQPPSPTLSPCIPTGSTGRCFPHPTPAPEIPQPPALTLAVGVGTRCWLQPPSSSSPAAKHRLLLLLWCSRPGWGPTQPSPASAPPPHEAQNPALHPAQPEPCSEAKQLLGGVRAWHDEPAAPCP